MGDHGSIINWSIYAGLPIPLYDPTPPPSVVITHLQKPSRPNRCNVFQDIASASDNEPCIQMIAIITIPTEAQPIVLPESTYGRLWRARATPWNTLAMYFNILARET